MKPLHTGTVRLICVATVVFILTVFTAGAWTTNDVNVILNVLPAGTVHSNVMMRMRDGTRLCTHYFLPAGYETTNFPVALMRSGYNDWNMKAGSSYAGSLVTTNRTWKNTNGYVFAFQDLRGDGDSETNALFDPRLSDNEINDSYDCVEGIASNTWCNGRVGIFGGSGNGFAPFNAWFSRAPHLVVVSPFNTAPSLYEHWSFENGVRRWSYNWLSYRNYTVPSWPRPTLGNYYDRQEWQNIMLSATNDNHVVLRTDHQWLNFFLDGALDVYHYAVANTNNRVFLSAGGATHQGDIGLDFPNASGNTAMTGVPGFLAILDGAAVTNKSALDYFVMGDAINAGYEGNYRRVTNVWPLATSPLSYYLLPDGRMSRFMPTQDLAYLSYEYHPTNPVPSVGGGYSFGFNDYELSGTLNQLVPQLTNRNDILRFETAPFGRALEVVGELQADLYISTDVEDTAFMVKLVDIYPNGATDVYHTTFGTVTGAYHAVMKESAFMARYRGGFTNPAPLVSGVVYRLQFDMSSLALLVEKGHRIGIHITSSSTPAYEVHPNTYDPVMSYSNSPAAHNKLYLCTSYPSRIVFPITTDIWTNPAAIRGVTNQLQILEGAQYQLSVSLMQEPPNAVTVTVERISGSTNLYPAGQTSLVFSEQNWWQTQYVAVVSAQDGNKVSETAVVRMASASPGISNRVDITVYAIDDELYPLELSTSEVALTEGATEFFQMRLGIAPVSAVTVTVSRVSGSANISVQSGGTNVFTPADWSDWQTVTIGAAQDGDGQPDAAEFLCVSPDLRESAAVQALVSDNDTIARRWLVDFGQAAYTTPGNWNNITNNTVGGAGSSVSNMLTDAGIGSGLSLTIDDAFNTVSGGGMTATNGIYPATAMRDSATVRSNSIGRFILQGMDTNATYDICLFSSYSGTANYEAEFFTVRGGVTNASVFLNGANNISNTAVIGGVAPWTNGTIQIVTRPGPNNNNPLSLYTYLSVVDIREISQAPDEPDTDGDGLPDDWERSYFGNLNANPGDLSANGLNTVMQCYIAGISPLDPAARFLITDLRPLISGNILQWQGVSGRVYNVYWTSNLLSGFQAIQSNVPWTGNVFTDSVRGAGSEGFYRLEVRLSP